MVLDARKRWPRYATVVEDEKLKGRKWKGKYNGKRVIFHDNTGIPLFKPNDAYKQRLTYSSYYGGNVAKTGVHTQLCGWIGVMELYPGAIGDSEYFKSCKILDEQEAFERFDHEGGPTVNVLDRGYRVTKAAWRYGQFILQPTFMRSDGKFTGNDTLRSSSIASDRSGNERAVRVVKLAKFYIKNCMYAGHKEEDLIRMCDLWLCQGFQINFSHLSVM